MDRDRGITPGAGDRNEAGSDDEPRPERHREALVDEAEKESFPASDPPESYRID